MSNITILDHPLIKHKISMLRDKNTGTMFFRILVEEISMLMGYEALRDLPTENVSVETPITDANVPVITGKKLAVVPILRAGLGMVNGILSLVPTAKIGHIGLYRDEETHEPHAYFAKLPDKIEDRLVILPDPMLATGGTASAAVQFLKERGVKDIAYICMVAAADGVKKLQSEHPDVDIYTAALDRALTEDGYIVPGLGDVGNRIYGTK
ncbi:MAG: uracil phosphoribosyltransferase [Firmicutes bacterium]|nr:uracil phosphoribosyltransferase [Bacillota bacterium]